MSESTTFSLRCTKALLERIDTSARARGETRSTYIFSWLPDVDPTPSHKPERDTTKSHYSPRSLTR